MADRPNILFFHVDNLGPGELSCYSGGAFRGAPTQRIDAFAAEGFRLTNYCPESQCTPTRSALLIGRHAIRSGTHSVPIGMSEGWGLVAWEKTLGELLTDAGYACAVYGKWHVGEGRWRSQLVPRPATLARLAGSGIDELQAKASGERSTNNSA